MPTKLVGMGDEHICELCDDGVVRVWDGEMEWYAHPNPSGPGMLTVCEVPWRAQCEVTCDKDSQCMLVNGHDPKHGHQTEHGCICYDQREP